MIADVYIRADLPALVRVFGRDFTLAEHAMAVIDEDEIILDAQTDKMYYIVDLREMQVSLDDMIRRANMAAHQFKNYTHQNVIENLMVVPYHLAQGLESSVFSGLRLKTFYAIEDAMAHIEQQRNI